MVGRATNRAGRDSVPTRGSLSVPNARVLTSPSLNLAGWLMHAVFHVPGGDADVFASPDPVGGTGDTKTSAEAIRVAT